jgi:hypothetical protein
MPPAISQPDPVDPTVPGEAEIWIQERRIAANDIARRRYNSKRNSDEFSPPESFRSLADELVTPLPKTEYVISGIHPVGTNTTVIAPAKTGKTTVMMNLIKSLADGVPLFDKHDVQSIAGRVAFFNYELTEITTRRNFQDMNIQNLHKIWHLPLRGVPFRMSLLPLGEEPDPVMDWIIAELKAQEIEIWILDPFSNAFQGDENSAAETRNWFMRLDYIKAQSGVKEVFLPVHTGKVTQGQDTPEQVRGSAKIEDWPDNRWILSQDSTGKRFFKATGRRSGCDEYELEFDQGSQALYAGSGTRARHGRGNSGQMNLTAAHESQLLAFVAANKGCSQRAVLDEIKGNSDAVKDLIKKLVLDGRLEVRVPPGKRVTEHYIKGEAPPAEMPPLPVS